MTAFILSLTLLALFTASSFMSQTKTLAPAFSNLFAIA
jgi:hypothetical protein